MSSKNTKKSKYNTYEDALTITEVSEDGKGFSVSAESSGFYVKKENIGSAIPKVGDKITLHVYGGSCIRGVDLNDKPLYYFTDEDIEEQNRIQIEKYNKQKELTKSLKAELTKSLKAEIYKAKIEEEKTK